MTDCLAGLSKMPNRRSYFYIHHYMHTYARSNIKQEILTLLEVYSLLAVSKLSTSARQLLSVPNDQRTKVRPCLITSQPHIVNTQLPSFQPCIAWHHCHAHSKVAQAPEGGVAIL